jgi:hypothetical protein
VPALDPSYPGALAAPSAAAADTEPPRGRVSSASGLPSFVSLRALAGVVAAGVWAAPRVWLGDDAPLEARLLGYLALVGCGSVSLGLLALSWGLPPASAGAPARANESDVRQWQRSLTLGLGLALMPWFGLAYWLEIATHHRPLGAVVFALGAAAVGVPCVALARRLLQPDLRGGAWARLCGMAALLAGLTTLAVIVVAAPLDDLDVRAAVLDLLLGGGLGFALVRASQKPGRRAAPRWLVFGAAVTCLALWGSTGWLLHCDTDVRARVKSAPVLAGAVGLLLR